MGDALCSTKPRHQCWLHTLKATDVNTIIDNASCNGHNPKGKLQSDVLKLLHIPPQSKKSSKEKCSIDTHEPTCVTGLTYPNFSGGSPKRIR